MLEGRLLRSQAHVRLVVSADLLRMWPLCTPVLKTHMSSATYGQAKNRRSVRFLAHLAVEVMAPSKIGFHAALQFYCLENNRT